MHLAHFYLSHSHRTTPLGCCLTTRWVGATRSCSMSRNILLVGLSSCRVSQQLRVHWWSRVEALAAFAYPPMSLSMKMAAFTSWIESPSNSSGSMPSNAALRRCLVLAVRVKVQDN